MFSECHMNTYSYIFVCILCSNFQLLAKNIFFFMVFSNDNLIDFKYNESIHFVENLKSVRCCFLWHSTWIANIFQSQWVTLMDFFFQTLSSAKIMLRGQGTSAGCKKAASEILFSLFFAYIMHCFPPLNRDCCHSNF